MPQPPITSRVDKQEVRLGAQEKNLQRLEDAIETIQQTLSVIATAIARLEERDATFWRLLNFALPLLAATIGVIIGHIWK